MPNRDLDQDELEQLVQELAAQPERWRHLVQHRPDERTYAELHRDEHVAIWLICWMDDHDTGYHDHDLSAGAVAVTAGAVREERLVLGGARRARQAPVRRSRSARPTSTASATWEASPP
jgi:cysteine dioxygenase type I